MKRIPFDKISGVPRSVGGSLTRNMGRTIVAGLGAILIASAGANIYFDTNALIENQCITEHVMTMYPLKAKSEDGEPNFGKHIYFDDSGVETCQIKVEFPWESEIRYAPECTDYFVYGQGGAESYLEGLAEEDEITVSAWVSTDTANAVRRCALDAAFVQVEEDAQMALEADKAKYGSTLEEQGDDMMPYYVGGGITVAVAAAIAGLKIRKRLRNRRENRE